jgi:hypothetical protein
MSPLELIQEQRQDIVSEFCRRHSSMFDPLEFLRETVAENHPAHAWFDWKAGPAISDANFERARQFAEGRKVDFRLSTAIRCSPAALVIALAAAASLMLGAGALTPTLAKPKAKGYPTYAAPALNRHAASRHANNRRASADYPPSLARQASSKSLAMSAWPNPSQKKWGGPTAYPGLDNLDFDDGNSQ